MAKPLACPHCRALLTDAEVVRLHRQYAAAQRKTKAGGHNGGRPPRYPERQAVSGFFCPNGCFLHGTAYRLGDQCGRCAALLVQQTPQEALDAARRHSNAVLDVGPEAERTLIPIDET